MTTAVVIEIGCSRISGLLWSALAPGHHGHPRTEGQSLNSDLAGSTLLSAWLSAGPTGHTMIINSY
jgi:hypothetical protein